jgi:hypothetical protein
MRAGVPAVALFRARPARGSAPILDVPRCLGCVGGGMPSSNATHLSPDSVIARRLFTAANSSFGSAACGLLGPAALVATRSRSADAGRCPPTRMWEGFHRSRAAYTSTLHLAWSGRLARTFGWLPYVRDWATSDGCPKSLTQVLVCFAVERERRHGSRSVAL